ncbi:MAG: hypothetical protein KC656_34705, partial [Myxococcales bacterium]|nr:hypothetical protein [Myxococcales bacterium]
MLLTVATALATHPYPPDVLYGFSGTSPLAGSPGTELTSPLSSPCAPSPATTGDPAGDHLSCLGTDTPDLAAPIGDIGAAYSVAAWIRIPDEDLCGHDANGGAPKCTILHHGNTHTTDQRGFLLHSHGRKLLLGVHNAAEEDSI